MSEEAPVHVACPHCSAVNRIPSRRLGEDPTCGRCGAALLDGQPVALTDENFDAVTRQTDLPVVVDFWAPWCGPCHSMAPQFARAAEQLKGRALLVKLDTDENQRTAGRFGIRSIPTLVRLHHGQEVDRVSGARPADQIVAWTLR